MRNRWWLGPSLAVAVVVIAACGTNSPTPPATSGPAAAGQALAGTGSVAIKMMHTRKGTVLATAKGRTLYWFAIDTPTRSRCTGSCATYWPPVMGKAVAAAGTSMPHSFGTIKRANGQTQATYGGHPLYTYMGDTAAGQVSGNRLRLSGGLWWAVTPSGTKLRAKHRHSSSSSGGSGGGGW